MKLQYSLFSTLTGLILLSCGGNESSDSSTTPGVNKETTTSYTQKDIIRELNADGEYWFRLVDGDTLFDGKTFEITHANWHGGYCIVGKKIDNKKKYGAIDLQGNLVIDYKYDHLEKCEEGYFPFSGITENYGYALGYVDSTGKEVIPQQYGKSSGVKNGKVKLRNKDRSWGMLSMNNEVIVPFEYDLIGRWQEGMATVKKQGKGYGYINEKGELSIPLKYDDALGFESDVALVKLKGKWGLIDKNDQILADFEFEEFKWIVDVVDSYIDPSGYEETNDRFVMEEGYILLKKNGKWGYLNTKGETVVPFEYDYLDIPSDNYAAVKKDGNNGSLNISTGEVKWRD